MVEKTKKKPERKTVKMTPFVQKYLKDTQYAEWIRTGRQPSYATLIERMILSKKKGENLGDTPIASTETVIDYSRLVSFLSKLKCYLVESLVVLDQNLSAAEDHGHPTPISPEQQLQQQQDADTRQVEAHENSIREDARKRKPHRKRPHKEDEDGREDTGT